MKWAAKGGNTGYVTLDFNGKTGLDINNNRRKNCSKRNGETSSSRISLISRNINPAPHGNQVFFNTANKH